MTVAVIYLRSIGKYSGLYTQPLQGIQICSVIYNYVEISHHYYYYYSFLNVIHFSHKRMMKVVAIARTEAKCYSKV